MKASMLKNVYEGLNVKNVYEGLNACSEVYLFKEYFCKMYPMCVCSELCEFIQTRIMVYANQQSFKGLYIRPDAPKYIRARRISYCQCQLPIVHSLPPLEAPGSDDCSFQVLMAENDAIICVKSMMINENGR